MRVTVLRLLATALLLAGATFAQSAPAGAPRQSTAEAAFARMKGLQGEWVSKRTDGKTSHVKYDLTGGGSAVVERYWADDVPDMTTVYTLDGDRLLLTHYCMAKNQPRMQATAFDIAGQLNFHFLDATGLATPGEGHMHNASFRFIDNDHFTTRWEFFQDGKQKFAEELAFSRVR